MAVDIIKDYMKLTGLTEGVAKDTLARGDEFAEWSIPGGAAKVAAKTKLVAELRADETNAGTIVVETTPTPTQEAGAGEGTGEGDGNDLDGEDNGETVEE